MNNQPTTYLPPELSGTAYRRLLGEQHLPAFVYHPETDNCDLIEVQDGTSVDLAERAPTEAMDTLMAVLRAAAVSGKSFINRQELNGRLYTSFGFVNLENDKVASISGFLLPEHANGTERDFLFGRRHEDRDSFTGLYTKVAIKDYARRLIEADPDAPATFCMIDLDFFKEVNDTYGHEFGDAVILKTAELLRDAVEGIGVAGRFGGDEFFVVLYKKMEEEELRKILHDFHADLTNAFLDTPQHLALHCSMGVARRPGNGNTYEMLFAKADRALYIAKQKGRHRYIIYREALHGEITELESAGGERTLRTALHIDDTLHVTEEGIHQLYRSGAEVLPSVLREVCLAYEYDGAALYTGDDLHLMCESGSAVGVESLAVIKDPDVAKLIDATGMFVANFKQMHSEYIEKFYGLLERSGITTVILYRIGSKEAPRGAVLFHSHWENNAQGRMPSDEQLRVLGILAYVIGKTVLN